MLGFVAGAGGVLVDVLNRAVDGGGGVEVDGPLVAGPGGGESFRGAGGRGGFGGAAKRMEVFFVEEGGGAGFELVGQFLDRGVRPADDEVGVVGHDGEGVDGVVVWGGVVGEALGDGAGLAAGPDDRGAGEFGFGGAAVGGVVGPGGNGSAGAPAKFIFRRGAGGGIQLEGADEGGPRAAGIVGEPEAVGGEDEVVREDARHGSNVSRRTAVVKRFFVEVLFSGE